jgi:hypothetical protein
LEQNEADLPRFKFGFWAKCAIAASKTSVTGPAASHVFLTRMGVQKRFVVLDGEFGRFV